MLAEAVIAINGWIAQADSMAMIGAFLWGMISVLFSPCHLASIPLLVAYVGGQREILAPRQAVGYALFFSGGLFLTIIGVGVSCAFLGRMLGDVGPWWRIPVGLLLIWVGLGMTGVAKCAMGVNLSRWRIKGLSGALLLGLAYGLLSGICTFGFIAPILGIITLQQKVVSGILLILVFAAGHCLPLVVAGTFSAVVRNALASHHWQRAADWFRRLAALLIIGLGAYFIFAG